METQRIRALAAVTCLTCLVCTSAFAGDADVRIMEIEKALWAGWAKANTAPFEEHATDDVVNVVPDGITVGKAGLIEFMGSGVCAVAGYSLGDMTVVHPAEGVAILAYSAEQDAVCGGAKLAERIYVSSVYVKQDGEWKSASYSETPAVQHP